MVRRRILLAGPGCLADHTCEVGTDHWGRVVERHAEGDGILPCILIAWDLRNLAASSDGFEVVGVGLEGTAFAVDGIDLGSKDATDPDPMVVPGEDLERADIRHRAGHDTAVAIGEEADHHIPYPCREDQKVPERRRAEEVVAAGIARARTENGRTVN